MRLAQALSILLVAMLTAGCLQVPDQEPAGGRSEDDPGSAGQDGGPYGGPGDDDGPDPGEGSDPGEGGEHQDDDDPRPACHEQEKTNGRHPPAPPNEQEVESQEEIRCPGHFIVSHEGAGVAWEAPVWQDGDWWVYQRDQFNESGYSCHQVFHETVNGTGESWEVPVYRMDLQWHDCNGNQEKSYAQNRTRSSVSEFSDHRWGEGKDHGYVNHFVLFPLRDGKRWSFMNAPGHMVDSQVSHEPNFLFQQEPVEAWKITSTIKNVEIIHWYGEQEKNLLREERRMTGFLFDYTELVDSGSGS